MPSNAWTQGSPLAGASTKAVLAERVYVAPADTAYSDPVAKLNGAAPGAPWTDLGIVMDSKVTLTYQKEVKPVETGIEKVRRGSYSMAKTCQAVFTLEQYDVDTIALVTGLSVQAVGVIGGKLHIGQDDVVERALLFLGTNKVDGKEHQMYCKKGSITWAVEDQQETRAVKVTADLYAFTPSGETVDAFFTLFVLD